MHMRYSRLYITHMASHLYREGEHLAHAGFQAPDSPVLLRSLSCTLPWCSKQPGLG